MDWSGKRFSSRRPCRKPLNANSMTNCWLGPMRNVRALLDGVFRSRSGNGARSRGASGNRRTYPRNIRQRQQAGAVQTLRAARGRGRRSARQRMECGSLLPLLERRTKPAEPPKSAERSRPRRAPVSCYFFYGLLVPVEGPGEFLPSRKISRVLRENHAAIAN